MKLISRLKGRCFCAYCKAERKVYVKKHIDLTNVVAAILLAMVVGQAYWGAPDPRALVLFCVTITGMEIFVYLRWRSSIVCSLCGFDPLVYKASPARAAEMVRSFYVENLENPEFWLTRSPLLARKREEMARERKANDYKRVEAKLAAAREAAKPALIKAANKSAVAPSKSP